MRGGLELKDAVSAVRNWMRGLYKPAPRTEDVRLLADALSVEPREISDWHSSCRYAPMTAARRQFDPVYVPCGTPRPTAPYAPDERPIPIHNAAYYRDVTMRAARLHVRHSLSHGETNPARIPRHDRIRSSG